LNIGSVNKALGFHGDLFEWLLQPTVQLYRANKEELRANRQSISGLHHSTQLKTNKTHDKTETTSNFNAKKFSSNSERMKAENNRQQLSFISVSLVCENYTLGATGTVH